jgi:hypothetical protein
VTDLICFSIMVLLIGWAAYCAARRNSWMVVAVIVGNLYMAFMVFRYYIPYFGWPER